MVPSLEVRYSRGVFLPAAGIWLDPSDRKEFAFVSHAHMDHTGRHERILCSPPTGRLTAARTGLAPDRFQTVKFGEAVDFDGWQGTLLPAGHVLGSAQLFVEAAGESLLYTGDFKMRPGMAAEPIEARHADTLIMETTYGLPKYRFPPFEDTVQSVVKFCREALEEGSTPVLLAYALGKAQEILAALEGSDLPVMVHGSVAKMVGVYREFGIRFPEHASWNLGEARGHVLLCPPGAIGSKALNTLRPRAVAALTGWALDPGMRFRMGVDAAFPISDHADYDELLAYVEAVNPRRVLTLHGFAREFARDLRSRGIEAWALGCPNQLEWEAFSPPAPRAVPPSLPPLTGRGFDLFVDTCEGIRHATGRQTKVGLLASYFRRLDSRGLRLAAVWLTSRIFPESEPQKIPGIPGLLRKSLALATGLPEPGLQALLRNTRDPGEAAMELLATNGSPARAAHSLADIAALFHSLAAPGPPTLKTERLSSMLVGMHPAAAGYVVRLVAGDLRIGLKPGLVEEALSEAFEAEPMAVRDAALLTRDIGTAAVLAANRRLDEAKITLFLPVKLTGSHPSSHAWSPGPLGEEGEISHRRQEVCGLRVQIHSDGRRAEIFDDDLAVVRFPEIEEAILQLKIPIVMAGIIPSANNTASKKWDSAGDLFAPPAALACFVFDLLLMGDLSLVRTPLQERLTLLEALDLKEPLRFGPPRIGDP